MTGRLPDFLIVGAMKAGTTSLAAWLRAHPRVFVPDDKELHFFDVRWNEGLDWYRAQFADASDEEIAGEATPSYMVRDVHIQRMASVVPDARLIVLLRNPVDRAWSQFNHSVERDDEHRSFEEAVDDELVSDPTDWRTSGRPLARGRYIEQLRMLEASFPRERIHVGLFDELVGAPHALFAKVCGFLGVAEVRLSIVGQEFNPRTTLRRPRLAAILGKGRALERLPGPLQRRARTMVESRPRNAAMPPAMRSRLREYFRPYNDQLAAWLGVDLSAWNR